MSKVSVTASWDGLPPINAEEVISLIPNTLGIEVNPASPTTIDIEEKKISRLQMYLKPFGLEVNNA